MQTEMDKVQKVAMLVGGRMARLVTDARRNASGNTQLTDELKRYNRRLEVHILTAVQESCQGTCGVPQGAHCVHHQLDRRLILGSQAAAVPAVASWSALLHT